VNVLNNVILARDRQLPDDDRMIETCGSIFKSFNINDLNVCIGWCTDQVTLRSAWCNDKDYGFMVVTPCSLVEHYQCLEKPAAAIFKAEG